MAERKHAGYQADVHCYSLARSACSQCEPLDVERKYRLRNTQADHYYKQAREEYEKTLIDHVRHLSFSISATSTASIAHLVTRVDKTAEVTGERKSLVISLS